MLRPVFALLLIALTPTLAEARNQLACTLVPRLMRQFTKLHVAENKMPDVLAKRFVKAYLENLDPSKVLLLEAEANAMRSRLRVVYGAVESGNCAPLLSLHRDHVAAQKALEDEVRALVQDKAFKLDKSVSMIVDRDKLTRSKTAAERTELRRKQLQFQLAGYLQAGTELKEAKKKLIHRYELVTKRLAELSEGDLLSSVLSTYAAVLDPHSSYLSADQLEDFRISMRLSLEGIGASLSSQDGYTVVREVIPGGAADRDGRLKVDDKIIGVAQGSDADSEAVDVVDMALREVVRMIRGKKGTQVVLTILRKSERIETLKIAITRDKIDLKEQAAQVRYEDRVVGKRKLRLALVELPSFYGGRDGRNCTSDVEAILAEIRAQKADGVVLDLSRNSGGLLQAAVQLTGFFIQTGAVVGIEGNGASREILEDEDDTIQYAGPLVVLTSRGSASASEILAGAIKDYGRGLLVGDDHTFGKGSVQHVVNLKQGYGALKVTMAMFFRPGGQSTQSRGVPVDIVVPSGLLTDELGEKYQDFALAGATTRPFLSKTVNDDDDGFAPINPNAVAALASKSQKRVAENKAFAEMAERLEKARNTSDEVKLSELMDDSEDAKKDTKDEKEDEDKLRPNQDEALNILADLIAGNKRPG